MVKGLKIGDFGRFHFTLENKKGSHRMGFNVIATVVEIDRNFVLLQDNDDIEYLPKKVDITKFKRRFTNEQEDNL